MKADYAVHQSLAKFLDAHPNLNRPFQLSNIWLVAILVCAVFAGVTVLEHWGGWAGDFGSYYFAGYFFRVGEFDQVYAGPPDVIGPEMSRRWSEVVQASGGGDNISYPFIYLPWVAAVMAPVSRFLGPYAGMNVMLVINILSTYVSIWCAWRIMDKPFELPKWLLLSVAMLATSVVSVLAISHGQLQIAMFALCAFAFERYKAGKTVVAGVMLGLAACLKITPAAFAIIFLWDRNGRALASFVLFVLCFAGLSIALIGWPLHAEYLSRMEILARGVFMSKGGASMEVVLYQAADLIKGTAETYTGAEYLRVKPLWIEIATKGLFFVGLVLIWYRTRGFPDHVRLGAQLLPLAVLLPLMAPLGWVHYYLLAAYLFPAMALKARPFGRILFIFFLIMLCLPAMYFLAAVRLPIMLVPWVYASFFSIVFVYLLVSPVGTEKVNTVSEMG